MAINENSARDDDTVYRLAFYGGPSSGKTCILSALSLSRIAHPEGLTCSWIENVPGHALPAGDPATLSTNNPYHHGREWLTEQRRLLKSGEPPAPNPNRAEPMRFRFDFGSRDHGTRRVELIDYSGELVTMSAGEFAAKLSEHMLTCDGLLVLAEVPFPGRDETPLTDDLEKLKSAFLLLLGNREDSRKQEWPIALLFNKWDRRSEESLDASNRGQLIDDFLNGSPQPPHASLVDTIRNAVGDDNYCCFPVSAFGSHEVRSDGMEVPRLRGTLLESRGLEDGFIWVVDRCDAMRVEGLEEAASSTSWWAFPQLLIGLSVRKSRMETKQSAWNRWGRGVSALSGVSTAWQLCQKFPKNSPLHSRTFGALRNLAGKTLSQFAVFAVSLILLTVGVEYVVDGYNYRNLVVTRDNPAATPEQLQQGEEWLADYFVSPAFRHWLSCSFRLDRSEAHRLLVSFRTRRDEEVWKTVTNAKENEQTYLALVNDYVKSFPAGLHHTKAQALIAHAKTQQLQEKNEEYLATIRLKIDSLPSTEAIELDILHEIFQGVGNLPHPDASSEQITDRQQELRTRISEKQEDVIRIIIEADWEEFKQSYYSLMQSLSIADAASALASRSPKDSNLELLVVDFTERAPAMIQEQVQSFIKKRSFGLARDTARLSGNQNVVSLLPPSAVKDLQKLEEKIDRAEDSDLYAQILRYKPQCMDQINVYLSGAPLKTMESEVRQYEDWIKKMNGPLKLTLSLTAIQWHEDYWATRVNYYNDVTVHVAGKPLIEASGVVSKANERSADLGEGTLEHRMNDTITIDVAVVARYGWISMSTMSGGSGSLKVTPNQLTSGITIPLYGSGFTNKATFALTGVPTEPALPEWKIR